MFKILWIIFLIPFSIAQAKLVSLDFSSPDYTQALEKESYVRFDMESTKLGLITTEFTGVVKKFTASAEVQVKNIVGAQILFRTKDMDTDSDGRNEKMWDTCLNEKKYPTITIKALAPIERVNSETTVPMSISILGKDHPINVHLSFEEKNSTLTVKGDAKLSIKKLNIPDPSIAIAEVNDEIKVSFQLKLKI